MRLRVPDTAIQLGDQILAWYEPVQGWSNGGTPLTVVQLDRGRIYVSSRGVPPGIMFHAVGATQGYMFEIERPGAVLVTSQPMYQGVAHLGPPNAGPKIPDWPKQCPKCGRANAAVLLFQSWDCRHGCFK